jgi:hypothetical protein
MSCARYSALTHSKKGSESMWKRILWNGTLGLAFFASIAILCCSPALAQPDPEKPPAIPPTAQPKGDSKRSFPDIWPRGYLNWSTPGGWKEADRKWPDLLEATSKRLEESKKSGEGTDSDREFIYSRVSSLLERSKEVRDNYSKVSDQLDQSKKDLEGFPQTLNPMQRPKEARENFSKISSMMEQSKQARDYYFRFDRLLFAANALLNAGDSISRAGKTKKTPQAKDPWRVFFMNIQGCYFRVQQADFFASISGEEDSEKYVKLASSFYQQARGAYDDRNYEKAMHLTEASQSIVLALESIAQAAIPIPKPPHIPK